MTKRYVSLIISLCLLATTITPAFATLPNAALFNWVEYKFADLFPKSQTVKSELMHEDVHYDLRSWSGVWGTRYLGITDSGEIIGLGDYTDGVLLSFGYIDDWEDAILADGTTIDTEFPMIVWSYRDGTFMGAPDMDFNRPSWSTDRIRKHVNYQDIAVDGIAQHDLAILDYNGDGILDAITGNSDLMKSWGVSTSLDDDFRRDILFLKGNADGTLEVDPSIDLGLGPVHAFRSFINDFNQDGYLDIFIESSGIDQPPYSGEHQMCLMSDGAGGYNKIIYEDTPLHIQYHAGASVDIDYDGDMDVWIAGPDYEYYNGNRSVLFENVNGDFILHENFAPYSVEDAGFPMSAEFADLDGDGYFEFVFGTNETGYGHGPATGFVQDGVTGERFLIPVIKNFGIQIDIDFYDIDEDGSKEIFISRTGDPEAEQGHYTGIGIQVLKYIPGVGVEDISEIIKENYITDVGPYIYFSRIAVGDTDGDGAVEILCNDGDSNSEKQWGWEYINGAFEQAPVVKVQ